MNTMAKFKLIYSLVHIFFGYTYVSKTSGKLPGMLFPRDSESRSLRHLDGIWNFRIDDSDNRNAGFEQKWYSAPLKQVVLIYNCLKNENGLCLISVGKKLSTTEKTSCMRYRYIDTYVFTLVIPLLVFTKLKQNAEMWPNCLILDAVAVDNVLI